MVLSQVKKNLFKCQKQVSVPFSVGHNKLSGSLGVAREGKRQVYLIKWMTAQGSGLSIPIPEP